MTGWEDGLWKYDGAELSVWMFASRQSHNQKMLMDILFFKQMQWEAVFDLDN